MGNNTSNNFVTIKRRLTFKTSKSNTDYRTNHNNRGMAYILNPLKTDIKKLIVELNGIGFHEKPYEKGKEFFEAIEKDTIDETKFRDEDCVIIIIISKEKYFEDDKIVKKFYGDNCENMKNKPKLFFSFELITEDHDGDFEDYQFDGYDLPKQADILICKHPSKDVKGDVENFCNFLNTFSSSDVDKNVMTEIIFYLSTLSDDNATVHETFTRRLGLGKKVLHTNISECQRYNKMIFDFISAIEGASESKKYQGLYEKLDKKYNFEDLKSEIRATPITSDVKRRKSIAKTLKKRLNKIDVH